MASSFLSALRRLAPWLAHSCAVFGVLPLRGTSACSPFWHPSVFRKRTSAVKVVNLRMGVFLFFGNQTGSPLAGPKAGSPRRHRFLIKRQPRNPTFRSAKTRRRSRRFPLPPRPTTPLFILPRQASLSFPFLSSSLRQAQ